MKRLLRWLRRCLFRLEMRTLFPTRVLAIWPDFTLRPWMTSPSIVVRCRTALIKAERPGDIVCLDVSVSRGEVIMVRLSDYGITWCRGWREEDAQVLLAAAALASD